MFLLLMGKWVKQPKLYMAVAYQMVGASLPSIMQSNSFTTDKVEVTGDTRPFEKHVP